MNPFAYLFLIFAVALGIRLFIGVLNHNRIRNYLAGQGSEALSIKWHPFGAGWFGEKDSAIYLVRYRDGDGAVHESHCKTGIFSGTYFSHDIIVNRPRRSVKAAASARTRARRPGAAPDVEELMLENRRLRDEVAGLRRELEAERESHNGRNA